MNFDELEILKKLINEDQEEVMKTPPKTFEDDPMGFILKKYQSLRENLEYLLGDNFEEYLTAIYIIAPKPTMFKIVLHNGQYFFMTYMGETYQATIGGKNYLLFMAGEKQRAMLAISRLLRWGSPLKTKGGEGAEEAGEAETGSAEEIPPAETSETGSEEGGGEEETETLEESKKILTQLIEGKEGASKFEQISVDLWNAAIAGSENAPKGYKQYENLFQSIKKIVKNQLKTKQKLAKYSQRKDAVTEFWHDAHGTKKVDEPKTDIKSEDSSFRISVKKGASQLMSPEPKEAIATVMAAAEMSGISKTAENKAIDIIQSFARKTRTSDLNTKQLSKSPKAELDATNKKARKIYDDAQIAHKEFMEYIEKQFNKSPEFKRAFVYEAASGFTKFGKKSPAEANYVLAISGDASTAVLKDMTSKKSVAIDSILGKVKFAVTMKSTSYKKGGEKVGYSFYSSLRIGLEDIINKTSKLGEAYNAFESKKNKGLLNEDKIELYENWFNKAINFIKEKIENLYKWILEKIEYFIELIKSGINGLLTAMGIDVEVPEEVYTQEIEFA